MKKTSLDKKYFAKNIYAKWKSRVSKAQESITVYTPFLDGSLVKLLEHSNIENEHIVIVTDLNPESILQQPKQLVALKQALVKGITVKNAHRLHAKVLLIDSTWVTVGSQNFTNYGKGSKECTVIERVSLEGTSFVETLIKWKNDAKYVDEDLIDILISKVEKRSKQYLEVVEETKADFEAAWEHIERQRKNALRQKLQELEDQSLIKLASRKVYASIETVVTEYDEYDTLLAHSGYDMTKWVTVDPDGEDQPYNLVRLAMYPLYIADTGRMGFARIAKTRITYVYQRSSIPLRTKIGGLPFLVKISFLKTETHKRNVKLAIESYALGRCEINCLFTGDELHLVTKRYIKSSAMSDESLETLKQVLETEIFSDMNGLYRLFVQRIKRFSRHELNIDNKNIRDYFNNGQYELSVIQFKEVPILVIKADNPTERYNRALKRLFASKSGG